jgi:putative aldouronate transport system permease protein
MSETTIERSSLRSPAGLPRRGRKPSARPIWEEQPSVVGQTGKGIVLVIVAAAVLVPLYAIIITSLSDKGTINRAGGLVLVPRHLTLSAYRIIISGGVVTRSLAITFGITIVGTAISMVASVLCAYGLSRARSFGHRAILLLLIITMFVSGGLIPTFLVVVKLGGFDKYWALLLPSAISVFNILVLRAFYSGTTADLIDAARIDGASEWRILWSIVLPTSRAVTAVIALFYAVGYWNTFFSVILYMGADSPKWPIQYVLYQYVTLGTTMPNVANSGISTTTSYTPLSLSMAVVVLTLLPVVIVYPFMQRFFTSGVLTGAIKG